LSVGQLGDVAVYVRTSIVSTKYDTYKAKLEQFCRQQGWRNPRVYHDRAGGTVDEAELEKMARAMAEALKGGKVDADVIGRLAQMSETDAQHDRDDFKRLMVDINRGDIRVVVVHDLGQLGKSRLEAFGVLSDLMKRADVYMPGLGKIHGKTAFPPGSKTDYF
jgi:DNA invertase Pin-like site-specific DNA recombinase